jgi:hypothetical protein
MNCQIQIRKIVTFLSLLTCLSCRRELNSKRVDISVTCDADSNLVLSIKNGTSDTIAFKPGSQQDDATSRFDWELCSNGRLLARSTAKAEMVETNLIADRMGPIDVFRGRPLVLKLGDDYPELTQRSLLSRADTFLWYCRVWDHTQKRWIQSCGAVHLHAN